MAEFTLRKFRPAASKEVADKSARFITGFVIAMAGLLSFLPFAIFFAEQ